MHCKILQIMIKSTKNRKGESLMSDNSEKVKKPIYKKWWFWLIIIIVVVAIAGSQGGTTTTGSNSTSSTKDLAYFTASTALSKTSSLVELNLYLM